MGNEQEKNETFKVVVKRIDIGCLSNESFEFIQKNLEKILSVFYDKKYGSTKTTYLSLYNEEKRLLAEINKEKASLINDIERKKWTQIKRLLNRNELPSEFIFDSSIDKEDNKYPLFTFNEDHLRLRVSRITQRNLVEIDAFASVICKEAEQILNEVDKIKKEKIESLTDENRFLFNKLYKILSICMNLKIEYHFHEIYKLAFKISNELIIINENEYNFELVSHLVSNSSKYLMNMILCVEKKFSSWEIYSELFDMLINIVDAFVCDDNLNFSFNYFGGLTQIFRVNIKLLNEKFWFGDTTARVKLAKLFQKTIFFLLKLDKVYSTSKTNNKIEEFENNLLFLEKEYSKNNKLFFHNIKYKLPSYEKNIFFKKINLKLLNEVSSKHKFKSENFQIYLNQLFLFDIFDEIFQEIQKMKDNIKKCESSQNFIQKIIFNFHSSQLLIFIFDELCTKIEDYYNEAEYLIEGLIYLVNLDFVIQSNYISCEFHVKNLLMKVALNDKLISSIIQKDDNPIGITNKFTSEKSKKILSIAFKFLIHYHLNAIKLHLTQNLIIFVTDIHNKNAIVNQIYNLFEICEVDEIRLNISLLFLTLCLHIDLYYNFSNIEIIHPTSKFISSYIQKKFSKKESKTKNTGDLSLLISILNTYCDETHFRNYFSTNVFYDYLSVPLLLYYIDHPQWSKYIHKILNHFLYFYACKAEIMKDEHKPILYKLQMEAYSLVSRILEPARTYLGCCNQIDKISQIIQSGKYKKKYLIQMNNERLAYFNLVEKSQNVFFNTISLLPTLIPKLEVLLNLCLINDFETRFTKVFEFDTVNNEKGTTKHINLYNELRELDDLLSDISKLKKALKLDTRKISPEEEEKQQMKLESIVNDNEECIYKITIIRMIKEPFSIILSPKLEGYKTNNVAQFSKLLEEIFYLDYDLFHKVIFSINRFVMYLRLGVKEEEYKKMLLQMKENKDKTEPEKFKSEIFNNLKLFVFNVSGGKEFSLVNILFQYGTPSIINREILRLLCTLSMFSENLLLHCEFNSRKYFIDYTNINEIKIVYDKVKVNTFNSGSMDPEIDFKYYKKKGKRNDKIFMLPYKAIPSCPRGNYFENNGILIDDNAAICIPKLLFLPVRFTIEFSYYRRSNINDNRVHTLLCSKDNNKIIFINESKKLCLSTTNQKTIPLDFKKTSVNDTWITCIVAYTENYEDKTKKEENKKYTICIKISQYFISENKKKISEKIEIFDEKKKLPKNIFLIGNSINLNEPFEPFCNIKIYNEFIEDPFDYKSKKEKNIFDIKYFYGDNKEQTLNFIIKAFTNSKDCSDETLSYAIKLLNNLQSQLEFREKTKKSKHKIPFMNSELYLKVAFFCRNATPEIKKEISRFWKLIE